jgi:hypothetical protein
VERTGNHSFRSWASCMPGPWWSRIRWVVEFELRKPPLQGWFRPNPPNRYPIVTASPLKISRLIRPLLGGDGRLSSYVFLGFDSVIVEFELRKPPLSGWFRANPPNRYLIVTASSLKISRWIRPLLGGNGRLSSYAFLGFDSVIVSFGKWVSIILKLKMESQREFEKQRKIAKKNRVWRENETVESLSAHTERERVSMASNRKVLFYIVFFLEVSL